MLRMLPLHVTFVVYFDMSKDCRSREAVIL